MFLLLRLQPLISELTLAGVYYLIACNSFFPLSFRSLIQISMEIVDPPVPAEGEYNFDEKTKSLLNNGFDFDLGGFISRGHRLLMKDLGSYIGYELLVFLIIIVLGIIPFVGAI